MSWEGSKSDDERQTGALRLRPSPAQQLAPAVPAVTTRGKHMTAPRPWVSPKGQDPTCISCSEHLTLPRKPTNIQVLGANADRQTTLGAVLYHITTPQPSHKFWKQFCEARVLPFPRRAERGAGQAEAGAAEAPAGLLPLRDQASAHACPGELGATDEGFSSSLLELVWGGGSLGGALELSPALIQIRRLRKHEVKIKNKKRTAGCHGVARKRREERACRRQTSGPKCPLLWEVTPSKRSEPEPRGRLTSTRRPMLAMCGEQSLTVSSFSIYKRQRHSSKSESQVLPENDSRCWRHGPPSWFAKGLLFLLAALESAACRTRPPFWWGTQHRMP